MKNLFTILFRFVGILVFSIALVFVVFNLFENRFRFEYGEMAKSSNFQECFKKDALNQYAITLGNSKALACINESELSKYQSYPHYNLAFSSSNLQHSKIILESLLARRNKPQYVLLEVSWFSFNTVRTGLHLESLAPVIIRGNVENQLSGETIDLYQSGLFWEMCKQFVSFPKVEKSQYADRWNAGSRINPYHCLDTVNFNLVFNDGYARIDDHLMLDFLTIISICKVNGIPLIFFSAPESIDYKAAQLDRSLILNKISSIAQVNNIPFIELSNALWDEAGNCILFDSHHVGDETAFTQQLIARLRELNLQ